MYHMLYHKHQQCVSQTFWKAGAPNLRVSETTYSLQSSGTVFLTCPDFGGSRLSLLSWLRPSPPLLPPSQATPFVFLLLLVNSFFIDVATGLRATQLPTGISFQGSSCNYINRHPFFFPIEGHAHRDQELRLGCFLGEIDPLRYRRK